MAIKWTCEAPEPGRRNAEVVWSAHIGPVRLDVVEASRGDWRVAMSYPLGDRRGHKRAERSGWPTVGEAMVGAERWARLTLEDWRDLGELGRVALRAWDGETNGGGHGG